MLSDIQKREFVRDGYIRVPDAIPMALVNRALRAVNHSIGNVGKGGENPERNRSAFFCAELLQADVILDLYRKSNVMAIAEELLGKGNVLPVESAKPYPRFPDAPGSPAPRLGGHIDGVGSGGNGMAKGTYFRSFTMFAVVYLMDLPEPESGNFTIWPGSHLVFRDYFHEHGHEVLANGTPRPALPHDPVMVTGKAGDLILAHHQIFHAGGYNLSPHVRQAVITRLRHKNVAVVDKEAYTDIWREWEGLYSFLN